MSTNRKKLYIPSDKKIAQEESKQKRKYFTCKTSKRRTHQIRIGEEFYKKVKEVAKNEDMMLSFMLDKICKFYFKKINNKRF